MNLNEYQNATTKTAIYPGKGEPMGLAYTALGLAGESGEVAEKVKKILRDKAGIVDDESRLAIQKELGDVLWYIAAVATELGLNLDEVAQANLDKLNSRKERAVLNGSGDNR
jgi:NTP pyrophosphatase (non-canonical NTP hydrolase)